MSRSRKFRRRKHFDKPEYLGKQGYYIEPFEIGDLVAYALAILAVLCAVLIVVMVVYGIVSALWHLVH